MNNRIYNESGKRHDMKDLFVGVLGQEQTLDALVRAMSDEQAQELFEYIGRMHEIEFNVVEG